MNCVWWLWNTQHFQSYFLLYNVKQQYCWPCNIYIYIYIYICSAEYYSDGFEPLDWVCETGQLLSTTNSVCIYEYGYKTNLLTLCLTNLMSECELMEIHDVLTNRRNEIVSPTIETSEGTKASSVLSLPYWFSMFRHQFNMQVKPEFINYVHIANNVIHIIEFSGYFMQ